MMSVATCSQPSLPIHRARRVERLGQVVERLHVVRWWRGSSVRLGTPHDSLSGTQAMMHGWLIVASTASVHSRDQALDRAAR